LMRLAWAALVLLAGCDLYFGQHHQIEDDCAPPEPIPSISLRDPSTGLCNEVSLDCGCGPCGIDLPNEPQCGGACDGLPEGVCLASQGCHAAYAGDGTFADCWGIAPVGANEGGDCAAFDAFTCAIHDDCISVFGTDRFDHCAPEPNAACGIDCGADAHCENQCGSDGSCQQLCVPNGACGLPCPLGEVCAILCDGTEACVAADACETITSESDCLARPDCAPLYDGMDCTCDASGNCTCASETFARCVTGGKL
jgi:hypothetical protein